MRSFYPCVLVAVLAITASAQQPSAAPNLDAPRPQTPAMSEPTGGHTQPPANATAPSSPSNDDVTPASATAANTNDDMPYTVKMGSSGKEKDQDVDPVFGVPPLPKSTTSMVGGRIEKIDGIRDRIGVKIFGGGHWTMKFDERTHFYRDGVETTFGSIKKGDRVYVDTMTDGNYILARNVRVITQFGAAGARGQVVSASDGSIALIDDVSGRVARFQITDKTQVQYNGRQVGIDQVRPGALVQVEFASDSANHGTATEIKLLATPGQKVVFAGKVTHLDLSTGELSVDNSSDHRTYDITLPGNQNVPSNLLVGAQVTVAAVFNGSQYQANSVRVDKDSQ